MGTVALPPLLLPYLWASQGGVSVPLGAFTPCANLGRRERQMVAFLRSFSLRGFLPAQKVERVTKKCTGVKAYTL